jgi:hypothetical protein
MLYQQQQQQHKRENDDAETTIASCTQTTPETKKNGYKKRALKAKTLGRSKTERNENTAAAWLIDEENSQNPNPKPNLDFSGNDVIYLSIINGGVFFFGKGKFEIVFIHKCS